MFGSTMLEVIIGLVFVFSLISLLASAIQEFIARIFALRSGNLKAGIKHFLAGEKELAQLLDHHALIAALGDKGFPSSTNSSRQGFWESIKRFFVDTLPNFLSHGNSGYPEYIPSHTFALALVQLVMRKPILDTARNAIEAEISKIRDTDVQTTVNNLFKINVDLKEFRKGLQNVINLDSAIKSDLDRVVQEQIQEIEKQKRVQPVFETVSNFLNNVNRLQTDNLKTALTTLVYAPGPTVTQGVLDLVNKLPAGVEKDQLASFLNNTSVSIDQAVKNIEAWYDDVMEQVSGWYKRKAQLILLVIGFAFAIIGNIDTISIYSALSRDATLRAAVVQSADEFVRSAPVIETSTSIENIQTGEVITSTRSITETEAEIADLQQRFQALDLPGGWVDQPTFRPADMQDGPSLGFWVTKIIGWTLTALAVTIGAPFWFDLLSKLVNLRSGFKPKEEDSSKQD